MDETSGTIVNSEEDLFDDSVHYSRNKLNSPLLTNEDYQIENCFNCLGEVDNDEKTIESRSSISDIFERPAVLRRTHRYNEIQNVVLFRRKWDKGFVLHSRLDELFKMARKAFMMLDCAAKTNVNVMNRSSSCPPSYSSFSQRKDCVDLYAFFHEYFACVSLLQEYNWCYQELLRPILSGMENLKKLMGPITSLPESILLHSGDHRGNKNDQPSHHIFHLHLDIRWMHANLLLMFHQVLENDQLISDQQFVDSLPLSKADISHHVNTLMFELVDLSFLKFYKLHDTGCCKKSPFSCSCIRDLWIYLYKYQSSLHQDGNGDTFWSVLCCYLEKCLGRHDGDSMTLNALHSQSNVAVSSKIVCSLWILRNISHALKTARLPLTSSHPFVEILLKSLVSDNPNESDLKTCLNFIEDFCLEFWEPKVEPIVCLWEYFNKKLNNTFYLPGSSIDSIATLSKTATGLLRLVRSFMESKRSCASNSFQHFIRILGLHLRKTKDTPRHWNVIKGRIFSKLSGPKIGTLTQTGEHHVVLLFVALAISAGVAQVEKKFIEIVSVIKKTKETLSPDLVQGLMALHALAIDERLNVSELAQAVVEQVNSVSPLENFDMLKKFSEEVREIFNSEDAIGCGLHHLIDSWLNNFLTCCAPAESSQLFESILFVVNRLKVQSCLNSPDQEGIMFVERLWEQLSPYFDGMSSHLPIQSADLAASLVVLFMNTGNLERVCAIMNLFISKDCGDVRLARRFISKLILNENVVSILPRFHKLIIKAWIRCCIACNDGYTTEMKSLTNFVSNIDEVHSVCSDGDNTLSNASEPFLYFCSSFRSKVESTPNIYQKQNLRERFISYFDGVDIWLKSVTVTHDHAVIGNVYRMFGNTVRLCSHLTYTKSKPNTVLQQIIDTLLLPVSVRNPEIKLSTAVTQAVRDTFHLFFEGLHSLLASVQDSYVTRIMKELIAVYIPRCVSLPSSISTSQGKFALTNEISSFNCSLRCLIFEMVVTQFFKKKSKVPHHQACHALKFLADVLDVNDRKSEVLMCFIQNCFERLCDMVMFSDEKSAAVFRCKTLMKTLLNCDLLRENSQLMDALTYSLSALCNEHLAWSSRQTFDLVVLISKDAPDLVARFLPQLLDCIKQIERKRGVGYDKNLRFGLERIESNLRAIKSDRLPT